MTTYYDKYKKYKSKYLDLKYKNYGCEGLSGELPDNLRNMFKNNTIYDSPKYNIQKMLNCSINQVVESGILQDVQNNNIILIDATNLMRNKWFIMFSLVIADNEYKKYIQESISKYITLEKDRISFDNEVKWVRHVIIKMINHMSPHYNSTYIACIQKSDNDPYKKYNINNSTLFWLPITCFSYVNDKQILCINDDAFGYKNEADDYALILMHMYFSNNNMNNVYILSGDNYNWYTGNKPKRMSIYMVSSMGYKDTFTYGLGFQKNDKIVNEIVSYRIFYNNNIYDNKTGNFDDYCKYMNIYSSKYKSD